MRTETRTVQIGEYLGNRAHTTVLHGYNKIRSLIETDQDVGMEVGAIKRKIEALFNSRNNLTCFDSREI